MAFQFPVDFPETNSGTDETAALANAPQLDRVIICRRVAS